MVGDVFEGCLATVSHDIQTTTPPSGTSFTVVAGPTAFLWSPAYSRATTLYAANSLETEVLKTLVRNALCQASILVGIGEGLS
jgi:hypothetical protein